MRSCPMVPTGLWSTLGEATESQRSYINHKVIPIARIKSRG